MAYDAFISYSHGADLDLAPVVRDGLQRLAKPWHKRRALSIFLDQASLELSSELGGSLDERIEDTRWLVLFMSEKSAESRWVGEEIAEWTAKKSKEQLALVLTSGEVVWDDAAKDFDYERSTAVSEGMRGVYTGQDSEPLFLDLRWTKELAEGEKSLDLTNLKFRDAIATLAAPIHGIPKDQLEGEDIRQFRLARRLRRAAISGLAMLTVIAVAAGIWAEIQRGEAIVQRDRSEARRLATVATVNAAEQTDLALLLALESLNTTETNEGWEALFTALSQPVLARSPLNGHEKGVYRLLFNPAGSVLATMGGDGTIRLWNPITERQIRKLEGHKGDHRIWEAAFSPDGVILATPGGDRTVRLWDVNTGQPLGQPLEGHESVVWDVAFSPDGTLLATASADSTVRLWDVERRKKHDPKTMFKGQDGNEVWEVAFSADGSRLLWVSKDGSLRSRAIAHGSEVEELLTGHTEWSTGSSTHPGIAFSHKGTKLAVASGDWTVQVWDVASEMASATPKLLVGHDGFVVDLAFSSDDKRLASASQDRTVRMWDVDTGQQIRSTMTGHDGEAFSVAFSPDGNLLASGSADMSVRLWDLGAGARVGRALNHGKWILGVAVSSDGQIVASAGMDSKIALWHTATGKLSFDVPGSHAGKWVTSLAFSPDAKRLASTGTDKAMRLWNVESGLAATGPLTHGSRVRAAAFSPDGKWLASAGDDGIVHLWNASSGAPVRQLNGYEGPVGVLVFRADGLVLASAGRDKTVRLWDVVKGTQLGEPLAEKQTGHQADILDAQFGPDGTQLLSVSGDGVVLRWDLATRAAEEVLNSSTMWTAATFSDDLSVMASGADDGSVRLWDMASRKQVGIALPGHTMTVTGLEFSRDGSLVISASQDGTVRLWPTQSQWPRLARAAVGRDLTPSEWKKFVDADRPYPQPDKR